MYGYIESLATGSQIWTRMIIESCDHESGFGFLILGSKEVVSETVMVGIGEGG